MTQAIGNDAKWVSSDNNFEISGIKFACQSELIFFSCLFEGLSGCFLELNFELWGQNAEIDDKKR